MTKAVRIIVLSDSHGDYETLQYIADKHRDDADMFLHLGDGEAEFLMLAGACQAKTMHSVRGNCDWYSESETFRILHVCGKRVFLAHGHEQYVKNGLSSLRDAAQSYGAKITLFGHTHIAMSSFDGGIHYLNPGSTSRYIGNRQPSYGIININEKHQVELSIIPL